MKCRVTISKELGKLLPPKSHELMKSNYIFSIFHGNQICKYENIGSSYMVN